MVADVEVVADVESPVAVEVAVWVMATPSVMAVVHPGVEGPWSSRAPSAVPCAAWSSSTGPAQELGEAARQAGALGPMPMADAGPHDGREKPLEFGEKTDATESASRAVTTRAEPTLRPPPGLDPSSDSEGGRTRDRGPLRCKGRRPSRGTTSPG